jgi:hypothetical protein
MGGLVREANNGWWLQEDSSGSIRLGIFQLLGEIFSFM